MKKVQDIMANDVVTANPEMNVADAAKLMLKEDVGCLVIMEGNEIKGIVTDRDLMSCVVHGHNIQECHISSHMTSPVITAQPDVLLIHLAKLMAAKRIKRVPITKGRELVGIVSFSDIAQDMDEQVAGMWSEWLELIAVTKTSAQHRRGRGAKKETSAESLPGKRFGDLIQK
jgi:CBS domain-containing protein